VYNENHEVVDTRVITSNNNFSTFLGGLAFDLTYNQNTYLGSWISPENPIAKSNDIFAGAT
jgi:hypothetical protein